MKIVTKAKNETVFLVVEASVVFSMPGQSEAVLSVGFWTVWLGKTILKLFVFIGKCPNFQSFAHIRHPLRSLLYGRCKRRLFRASLLQINQWTSSNKRICSWQVCYLFWSFIHKKNSATVDLSQLMHAILSFRWGDYRKCDTPKITVDNMLQHIQDTHPVSDIFVRSLISSMGIRKGSFFVKKS